MGLLRGAPVNLDDLLGYSKLQDVLNLLLGHLSEHDVTIQQLQQQCAEAAVASTVQKAAAQQLDSQSAALEQLLEDCAALKVREKEQDQILEQLRRGDDELQSRAAVLDEVMDQLRTASSALESREAAQDEAIDELRKGPGTDDRLGDFLRQFQEQGQDLKNMQDGLAGLSTEVSDLAQRHDNLESATKGLSAQELQKRLAEMTAGLETLTKRHDDLETRSSQDASTLARGHSPTSQEARVAGGAHGTEDNSGDTGASGFWRDGGAASRDGRNGRGTSSDGRDGRGALGDTNSGGRGHAGLQDISIKELETRIEQVEDIDKKMHARIASVEEVVKRFSSQIERLSSSGGGSGGSEDRQEDHVDRGKLSAVSESTQLMGKNLESLQADLTALRSEVDALRDGCKESVDKTTRSTERIEQLEESLATLQSTVNDELRSQIQALAQKEEKDVRNLSRQLGELRSQLGSLMAKGSSATSKCLTCFDRRYQQVNRVVIGTDGKTYRKRPSLSGTESADGDVAPERPESAHVPGWADRASRVPIIRGGAGASVYRHRVVQGIEAPVGTFVKLGTSASAGALHRERPQTASSGVSTSVGGPSRNASEPSFASDAAAHAAQVIQAAQVAQMVQGTRAAAPHFQDCSILEDDNPPEQL